MVLTARDYLKMRRELCAILFPYTTLFRSRDAGRAQPLRPECQLHPPAGTDRGDGRGAEPAGALAAREAQGHPLEPGEHRDRKSTRRNSSHLGNSYAVFSWKKKTSVRPERS